MAGVVRCCWVVVIRVVVVVSRVWFGCHQVMLHRVWVAMCTWLWVRVVMVQVVSCGCLLAPPPLTLSVVECMCTVVTRWAVVVVGLFTCDGEVVVVAGVWWMWVVAVCTWLTWWMEWCCVVVVIRGVGGG